MTKYKRLSIGEQLKVLGVQTIQGIITRFNIIRMMEKHEKFKREQNKK